MKKVIEKIKTVIYGLLGRFVVTPVVIFLSPFFKKDLIVFIGRDDGKFLDNIKYLYIYFLNNKEKLNGKKFLFLTENREVFNTLYKKNMPVVFFPSIRGTLTLLRTQLLFVDNAMWIFKFKVFLLKYAKKIQLWHGIGMKSIEFADEKQVKGLKKKIYNFLINRFPSYDVVISTSKFFTDNFFSKSFIYKEIWETGYPRNDVLFSEISDFELLFTDVDTLKYAVEQKRKNKKIILYAPTYRDTGGDPVKDKAIDLKKLNEFLRKNNLIMILKFHPDPHFNYEMHNYDSILFYDNSKDVYPLLKEVDCLITDYSSIYMDFLLINKPVIFFPYDYEKYTSMDRKFLIDYECITPGPKVHSQESLEYWIKKFLVKNEDEFLEERKKILNLSFRYKDGKSSERIFEKIINRLR